MKWKSHTAIARAIAVAADIHGEARQALYLGVIDPGSIAGLSAESV